MLEKPFAYCCAEAGGDPDACDCVNKEHGIAQYPVSTCLMVNCRNRAPADEAFCAKHRRASISPAAPTLHQQLIDTIETLLRKHEAYHNSIEHAAARQLLRKIRGEA